MQKITKFCDLEVKDLDQKMGVVKFYFSAFGVKDSDNDIILDGDAFSKTFSENFKRIRHLKDHDTRMAIGKPLEVGTDKVGAFMVSQLSKNTAGRDALIEYEEGLISEHSFGFNVLKEDLETEPGTRIIKEVRMWEASSLVAWGANEFTPMANLKSLNSLEDVYKALDSIQNILTRTDISDESAKTLQIKYQKLSSFMKSLEESNQPEQSTEELIEPSSEVKEQKSFDLTTFESLLKKQK